MKLKLMMLVFWVTLPAFAEGNRSDQWIEPKDGVVRAWNNDYPIFTGVARVRYSKSDASLTYAVKMEKGQDAVQTIVDFYKGKTIAGFTIGDFVRRDDFMPDAQGFSTGKKQRGKGLSIFLIPQGNDVVIYIHPNKQ